MRERRDIMLVWVNMIGEFGLVAWVIKKCAKSPHFVCG